MATLFSIQSMADIPQLYKNTAVAQLLAYHNLKNQHDHFDEAQLLVGTCMDFRIKLTIPEKFAFIIRTGGANLKHNEFHIAFALSVAKVKYMAIIGHTDCGMVNLKQNFSPFVNGLVNNAGWEEGNAERFFMHYAPHFEIGNPIDFSLKQVHYFRKRFPKITFVPMLYKVENGLLYLIEE